MVMRADVACAALDAAHGANPNLPAIYLTPRGAPLTQRRVRSWRKAPVRSSCAGRFEGLDQRAIEARDLEEIPSAISCWRAARLLPRR